MFTQGFLIGVCIAVVTFIHNLKAITTSFKRERESEREGVKEKEIKPQRKKLQGKKKATVVTEAVKNSPGTVSLCVNDKCCGFTCLRRDIAPAFTLASPGERHLESACTVVSVRPGSQVSNCPSPRLLVVSPFPCCCGCCCSRVSP